MSSSDSGNSFFEDIVNVATNIGTFGLAGFESEKGGLTTGVTGSPILSGVKDITGASAAEEANVDARKRFEEEKAGAEKARADAKSQSAREQVTASRLAGGARSGGTSSAASRGSRFSSLGGDEQDFLGL